MEAGIAPMLNMIASPLPEVPQNVPPPTRDIVEGYRNALAWAQDFIQETMHYIGVQVFALICTHYPNLDLNRVRGGMAAGTTEAQAIELSESFYPLAEEALSGIVLFLNGGTPPQ